MNDYHVYLPDTPQGSVWGCTATSVGLAHVAPGGSYPPRRHPHHHHFTWERGRILQAYQFLLICDGGGVLEAGRTRRRWELATGSLFVLFPGVWHRYAPHRHTGWVEEWVELRGPALDFACKRGLLDPDEPVINTTIERSIPEIYFRIHALAHENGVAHQDLISTLGLHLIALLGQSSREKSDRLGKMVQHAQTIITARAESVINFPALARELNVGYSHFRQVFKARTGISPKRFQQNIRMRRAEQFLANTDKPLSEIAELLGFSSPYHLSRQFKEHTRLAPRHWREKALAGRHPQFPG